MTNFRTQENQERSAANGDVGPCGLDDIKARGVGREDDHEAADARLARGVERKQ